MNVPGLVVLFIGGWTVENGEVAPSEQFLHEIVSCYPAELIDGKGKNLTGQYADIGHVHTTTSLASMLEENKIQQIAVGDQSRYGLLNQIQGTSSQAKQRNRYIVTPPMRTLAEDPAATASAITQAVIDELRRTPTDTLVWAALGSIAIAQAYGNPQLISGAASEVERAVEKLIANLLELKARLLLVGEAPAKGLAPVVFVDGRCEGLQSHADLSSGHFKASGATEDVAPTVFSLLQIPVPKNMPGNLLFPRIIG